MGGVQRRQWCLNLKVLKGARHCPHSLAVDASSHGAPLARLHKAVDKVSMSNSWRGSKVAERQNSAKADLQKHVAKVTILFGTRRFDPYTGWIAKESSVNR